MTQAQLVADGVTLRTLTFKYDPFGRRVQKVVAGLAPQVPVPLTTTYTYDGEDIVLQTESDGTTTTTTQFVHGPGIDEPLARVAGGQSFFYHADGLGSIVAITDSAQNVVARYSYDAFGMVTASDPVFGNAYAYTGREWDKELGLYYYRARYYDPMEGRFISKDPIGFAGGDLNLYRYVRNDPANWIDPSGLWTLQLGIGFTAGGIIGTTKSVGLVVGYNPNSGDLDFGFYVTGGIGLYGGASASLTVDATFSDNPCINDLNGWAGTAGVSGGEFFTGGYEKNTPMSNALPSTTWSGGIGGGTPMEGHGFATNTKIWGGN